jgi:hypothetical protein
MKVDEQKFRTKTISELDEVDTQKLKRQALGMINDYNLFSEDEFKQQFNYLYSTSIGIFNMIIRDKNNERDKKMVFNKVDFENNLDLILNQISISKQKKQISDNDSKIIVDRFSTKYIPEKFLKK